MIKISIRKKYTKNAPRNYFFLKSGFVMFYRIEAKFDDPWTFDG